MNIELFHVHIPKTAGTSLNATFENTFGSRFCNHDPNRLRQDASVRMAAAHTPLGSALRQFPNARLITVLREPESRMKSTFRHLYARRNWPAYADIGPIIGAMIDEDGAFRHGTNLINQTEFKDRFDNLLVRYLTPDPVPDRINDEHVNSALDAIGIFDHVLYQDRFAQGVSSLFNDLGFPDIEEMKMNPSRSSIPLWDALPEEIEPFLVYDKILYRKLLDRRDNQAD